AVDLTLTQREGRSGTIASTAVLNADAHGAALLDLAVGLGSAPWHLVPQQPPPIVRWDDREIAIAPLEFVNGQPDQRLGVYGTWRTDGAGALHLTAQHVYLDTLSGAFQQPARYGGVLDGEAIVRGTRDDPRIEATLTVEAGRVERVTYQKLAGRVDYAHR